MDSGSHLFWSWGGGGGGAGARDDQTFPGFESELKAALGPK